MIAVLIGGRWDGRRVTLTAAPPRIDVGPDRYLRIDDPDSGAWLGGYVRETVWTNTY